MNYIDVATRWLYDFNDEQIIAPEQLTCTEPIPSWWAEVTGPDGGTLLAEKWDQLASPEIFPQTKELLRSERTLGVVILRSYPGGPELPARWNLAIALDYLPNNADEGPIILRLDPPLDSATVPPWWNYFPLALRDFILNAHRSLREDALTSPGSPESTILASDRFNIDDPEDLCVFQTIPDPRELVLVAVMGDSQLYLDIGQHTYQGWEVPGAHDIFGGPRPVDLLATIDAYVVLDSSAQDDLPKTTAAEAIRPAPLRPRNPALDWPNDPFWDRRN